MSVRRLLPAALAAACLSFAAEDPADPWIDRIEPLGGQQGTATEVVLVGKNLALPARLEFDSQHLSWETVGLDDAGLRGRVRIAPEAPLGPHIATLAMSSGRSNSRMFYVDEFASSWEAEPNDTLAEAQEIVLAAQTLHGGMHNLADIDVFAFEAIAGERWTFDLRSLEYGGFLENSMELLDATGARVAFNDDRDDYLETPFIEHVFDRSGRYYLRLDQYRGPQRVNCNRNCGYMLRIGRVPTVFVAYPLGARPGTRTAVSLRGRSLADVESVWLAPVRRAEYYRLTFPFTVPLRTDQSHAGHIEGRIEHRSDRALAVRFDVPSDAWRGLWRALGPISGRSLRLHQYRGLGHARAGLPRNPAVPGRRGLQRSPEERRCRAFLLARTARRAAAGCDDAGRSAGCTPLGHRAGAIRR